jgi:UDP-N-acetylglucosamine 2-epimerase (non-hydrolysing)
VLVTYHPATQADEDPEAAFRALLGALDQFRSHSVILTYPNADNGSRIIIPLLKEYARRNPGRIIALPSLGFKRYLSALSGAAAVIGNSSSGIIEAPSFGVPTVNIGARQLGRLSADSVLHCKPEQQSISDAIQKALSPEFTQFCRTALNPYGQGNAAKQIVSTLKNWTISTQKRFYDLEF